MKFEGTLGNRSHFSCSPLSSRPCHCKIKLFPASTFLSPFVLTQDRAGTNSPLDFEVVGGWEVGHPIFIHKVEPKSLPEEAGLRVGDQVSKVVSKVGSSLGREGVE